MRAILVTWAVLVVLGCVGCGARPQWDTGVADSLELVAEVQDVTTAEFVADDGRLRDKLAAVRFARLKQLLAANELTPEAIDAVQADTIADTNERLVVSERARKATVATGILRQLAARSRALAQ